jgi:cytochrome oxidase Cu insertion factor (SCO1/SenC/PrrC family)
MEVSMTSLKPISATARIAALALVAAGLFAPDHARAHDGHDHGKPKASAPAAPVAQDHSGHAAQQDHSGHQDHSAHHGHAAAADHRMPDHLGMDEGNSERAMRPDGFQYKRGSHAYSAPAITLRNQNGQKVAFDELLAFERPVLLNFIFTSCSTICPVQSATFGQTQEDLAAIDPDYLMVSISIDPEYDTPTRLREYAELHAAKDNWVMLTGGFDDIFQVVRAFDAVYKGENKMYHRPLTFLRANGDAPWLRIEGLLGSEELAGEFARLVKPEVN